MQKTKYKSRLKPKNESVASYQLFKVTRCIKEIASFNILPIESSYST